MRHDIVSEERPRRALIILCCCLPAAVLAGQLEFFFCGEWCYENFPIEHKFRVTYFEYEFILDIRRRNEGTKLLTRTEVACTFQDFTSM